MTNEEEKKRLADIDEILKPFYKNGEIPADILHAFLLGVIYGKTDQR